MKKLFIFSLLLICLFSQTTIFGNSSNIKKSLELQNDDIISAVVPSSVSPGERPVVTVNYSASNNRDIRVAFQLDSSPYTLYVDVVKQVTAGSTSVDITVPIPTEVPLGNNLYQFQIYIVPSGGNFDNRLDNMSYTNIDVEQSSEVLDDLISMNAPNSVEVGSDVTIKVNYSATQERRILASLQSNVDNSTIVNSAKVVPAGSGTVSFQLRIPSNAPVANNQYVIQSIMTPVGGTFQDLFDVIRVENVDITSSSEFTDDIISAIAPEIVSVGRDVTVTVNYSASTNRDIFVGFQLDSAPFTNYTNQRVSVSRGSGTTDLVFRLPSNIPELNNAFQFQIYIVPTDGDFPDRLDDLQINNVSSEIIEDQILGVTAPNVVTQGSNITIPVSYKTTESRDIRVSLQLASPPYTTYLDLKTTVGATNSSVTNIDIPIPSNIPVANGIYQFQVYIVPLGGNFFDRLDDSPRGGISVISSRNSFSNPNLSKEDNNNPKIIMYPNPAISSFSINYKGKYSLEIYSTVNGKLMLSVFDQSKGNLHDVSKLSKGVYVARILLDNDKVIFKRFIKE
ncbi:T9SS type A sorting domain-containing protein [uncultured Aquimarina sp.]|uniref:T9SS type A sorting domain-containing protein n=1 Tax=uncultured Aquimarina sp. TaxID=575652 RepID=UPI00260CB940|nr:T9SS type A sorting domain-containing protein [uncultured Aquimarina sp.]